MGQGTPYISYVNTIQALVATFFVSVFVVEEDQAARKRGVFRTAVSTGPVRLTRHGVTLAASYVSCIDACKNFSDVPF